MRGPRDLVGFFLPLMVFIISVVVVVARNQGVKISQVDFYLACGFGSLSLLVLLLSIPGSNKRGKDGDP